MIGTDKKGRCVEVFGTKALMLVLALSLCLASLSLVQPSRGQTSQNAPTQSEIMYVYWLLDKPGDWSLGPNIMNDSWGLLWNIWLHVDNISTMLIPLNLSGPAFNKGFEGAAFDAVPYGFENWWLTFHASFSPMDVDLAENYTDVICSEFQQAFNLTATVVGKTYTIDNQTGAITVYCNLGYFTETVEFLTELEEYKPKDGFGQLVTPEPQGGILEIIYSLGRADGGAFYWSFETGYVNDEGPLNNGDYTNLDLNELLNRTGEITPAAEGSSTIMVEVQNNDTSNGQFCSLRLQNISPPYDSMATPNGTLVITYNLEAPIGNIVAAIKVTIRNEVSNPFQNPIIIMVIIAAISAALICGIAMFYGWYRREREVC